jgi:hypothetical protein
MQRTQQEDSGTSPPVVQHTLCLYQIPRYLELYRATGKLPRIVVGSRTRLRHIDLPTSQPCRFALSSGRTFLLKPGRNVFEPPLELNAGSWFRLSRPRCLSVGNGDPAQRWHLHFGHYAHPPTTRSSVPLTGWEPPGRVSSLISREENGS